MMKAQYDCDSVLFLLKSSMLDKYIISEYLIYGDFQ